MGRLLSGFLQAVVGDDVAGSLSDWESALEGLYSSLADLPDCRIPLDLLQAAVKYVKTGEVKALLGLPMEQRQLLEDILLPEH